LPSFKLALAGGADLVELDYHHTKDGVPIVIHDYDLDRTTDATNRWSGKKTKVADKTLAELESLQAGNWFQPPYPDTRLPKLTAALDVIQPTGVTLIERKAGDATTCIHLLREKNLINSVVVQSFDWDYLSDFHRQEPRQVLGALGPPGTKAGKTLTTAEKVLNPAWVDEAKQSGVRVIGWNKQVTKEAIGYAHDQGLKVWVYTIDEPEAANELLDMGVDGIISNNVSIIWRTVALRNRTRIIP